MANELVINSHFYPYRLSLSKKEPVQLTIELVNRSKQGKMLHMEVILPRGLSTDKGGLVGMKTENVGELAPNASKKFYYDIYPKVGISPGEMPITIKVYDYRHDIKDIQNVFTKNIELTVVE